MVGNYQDHRNDMDHWGDPEPIRNPDRLDVTISVRFTADEIAGVRHRAQAAGVKLTVFIHQAALQSDHQLDRRLLAKTFDDLGTDVDRLASVIRSEPSSGRTEGRR